MMLNCLTRPRTWCSSWTLSLAVWFGVTLLPVDGLAQSDDGASKEARPPAPRPRLTPRLSPRPQAPPTSSPRPSAPRQSTPDEPPAGTQKPDPKREESNAAPSSTGSGVRTPPVPKEPTATAPLTALPEGSFYPPLLPAYKKLDPPPGYVDRRRINRPLFFAGGSTLVLTYGLSIVYGAGQNFEEGLGNLFIPVLGPWVAIGQRDFECDVPLSSDIEESSDDVSRCITREAQTVGVLVGLGIGQLIGGVLTTVGLVDRKKRWLRADLAGVSVDFDPALSPEMTGLVAKGTF